jgi:hypothetical protein
LQYSDVIEPMMRLGATTSKARVAQEIAMALFDPVSITREIEATPFRFARNVIIAYPHFEDWKKLYKPQPLRMPDARGIYRNVDAFESRYQDMKRDHENHVLKCLGMIQRWAAGRAVLAELRAWRSFSVYILPFDFLPSADWKHRRDETLGAITEPITLPQTAAERARRTKPRGTQVCKKGSCWANPDSHTGKSADVFYTARRFPDGDADGALLHELVHAMRLISGAQRTSPMGGGYHDTEEFLANTIEMIYRSEKRLPIYDYGYRPLDAASFLDRPTMASVELTDLRVAQQSLFDALLKVNADFNPIKQLDDRRRKLLAD